MMCAEDGNNEEWKTFGRFLEVFIFAVLMLVMLYRLVLVLAPRTENLDDLRLELRLDHALDDDAAHTHHSHQRAYRAHG